MLITTNRRTSIVIPSLIVALTAGDEITLWITNTMTDDDIEVEQSSHFGGVSIAQITP